MAIVFDASSSGQAVATSLTFAHTNTGSNLILFVGTWQNSATDNITGITYNNVAMTKIDGLLNSDSNNYLQLWYLVGPAAGANNVVVSASSSTNMHALSLSYTGASQTGQPDAHNTQTSSVISGGTQTVSVTTIADNCGMVCLAGGAGDLPTASTNFTNRVSANNERFGDHTSQPLTPAGSKSMSVTNSGAGSESVTLLAASFSPAAATSTSFRHRMMTGIGS